MQRYGVIITLTCCIDFFFFVNIFSDFCDRFQGLPQIETYNAFALICTLRQYFRAVLWKLQTSSTNHEGERMLNVSRPLRPVVCQW